MAHMHLGLTSRGGKSYRCSSQNCHLAIPALAADEAVTSWVGEYLAEDWHDLEEVDSAQAKARQLREGLARVSSDERALAESEVSMQFKLLEAEQLQKARTVLEDELQAVSAQTSLAVLLGELKSRLEFGLPSMDFGLPITGFTGFGLPMAAVHVNARAVSDAFADLSLEQQRTVIRSLAEIQVKPGFENGHRLPPLARMHISPRASRAEES
jgi:hypothetical protein